MTVLYLVFVRTAWRQELDDAAFDGRSVVSPEQTAETDRLLQSITRSSLALLGGALVLIAVGRGRGRLAVVVAAALGGSLLTSELLKTALGRPELDGAVGIIDNSFPSGHATIGMSLSLGLVVARRWRWLAAIVAAVVATVVGTGVLTSGWHRPSDSVAAALVTLAWFAAGAAVLIAWRGPSAPTPPGGNDIDDRAGRWATVGAGALVVAAAVSAVVLTLRADGLRTVEYGLDYVVACILIDVMCVAVVAHVHFLLRGVDLDPREVTSTRRAPPLRSPAA